jgi:hypothetical protein
MKTNTDLIPMIHTTVAAARQSAAEICWQEFGALTRPRYKRSRSQRCSILGVLVAVPAVSVALLASGQSWYTVDDFQYSLGNYSAASGLAKDPSSTIIYSAGWGEDATSLTHALAFKSSDGGMSWSTMDDYVDPTGGLNSNPAITADSVGNLYVSAQTWRTAPGSPSWFTRRSTDGGATWVTVDTLPSSDPPAALAADKAGNVYVVGGLRTSTGSDVGIVRIGTGGISWATVALPARSAGNFSPSAGPAGVFCHPTAGVFVVGEQLAPKQTGTINSTYAWTVWRSQDGGHTWATVDTFQVTWEDNSNAMGGGTDKAGNIFVVGRGAGPISGLKHSGSWHWVVRKSADGGNTWSTVDDFVPQPYNLNPEPFPQAFGSDSTGNLFVAGTLTQSGIDGGREQWLVRESVGGTGTWTTVDSFQYASGQSAQPYAVLGDTPGHIYIAGYGTDAAGVQHWIVRKH